MKKLNKTEQGIISTIMFGDKTDVVKKIRLAESKAKFVKSAKSKVYIQECIRKVVEDINKNNFKDSVTKVYQLKETVQSLLEKEQTIYELKFPDLQHLKNVVVEALPGETTETVYLSFKIPFYPVGTKFAEVFYELKKIAIKLSGFGKVVINTVLRENKPEWPMFTGDGIWESTMPEFRNMVGKTVNGSVEFALNTTGGSLEELRPEISRFLSAVNDQVPRWFGEVATPEAQQTALSGGKVEKSDDEDIDEPEVKDDWEKSDTEFDVDEKEPSEADLAKMSKRVGLAENRLRAALLKEKLEKLSGKKVIYKENITKADIKSVTIGSVMKTYGGGYAVYVTLKDGTRHPIKVTNKELATIKGGPAHSPDIIQNKDVKDFAIEKINSGNYNKVEKLEEGKGETFKGSATGQPAQQGWELIYNFVKKYVGEDGADDAAAEIKGGSAADLRREIGRTAKFKADVKTYKQTGTFPGLSRLPKWLKDLVIEVAGKTNKK